jgi:membrane protein
MWRVGHEAWEVLKTSYQGFTRHGCPTMAAAIGLYFLLSVVPFALLAVATFGSVLGAEEARTWISNLIRDNVPVASESVLAAVHSITIPESRAFAYVIGLIGLLWAATTLPAQMSMYLTTIWADRPVRGFLARRLMALAVIAASGGILLFSLVLAGAASALAGNAAWFGPLSKVVALLSLLAGSLLSPLLFLLMLFLLYRFLPAARVSGRAALLGAILGAILLHVLRAVFTALIVASSRYGEIYGPLAGAVVLLLWAYYSAVVLLGCAEIAAAYQRRSLSDPNGS